MTRLEYLQTLPEPYSTQAIENVKREDARDNKNTGDNIDVLKQNVDPGKNVLMSSFTFSESAEGYDYWFSFLKTL